MAEQTLLEWAEKQSEWTRDALRRHALCAGSTLSDADKAAIVERVRYSAGFPVDPVPSCEPLTGDHLGSGKQPVSRAELCSLGPVQHLNRLAANQQLNFATNGITLIYGDNGSGKSGYARVTKKICRSLTADDLLGNVFDSGERHPAQVNIRYRLEGDSAVTEAIWVDGTPTPSPLAQISVFDTRNARLYIDQQNRIGFLPEDISMLQRHGALCSDMDAGFRKELSGIEKRVKVPLPAGYTAGGEVANLLASLDINAKRELPSADSIKMLAEWTEADAAELQGLETLLASDPVSLAARCRRAKAALEAFSVSIPLIELGLSKEAASGLEDLHASARTKAEAAALAATELFASHPLQGVGQSAWRLMYDYAKAYAESLNGDQRQLPEDPGERCVLCQEPLTTEAAARVKGFNDFVAGTASKAAQEAREAYDQALANIRGVQISTKEQADLTLGEYGGINDPRKILAAEIAKYCAAAIARRDALLKATTPEAFSTLPALLADPTAKIATDISALEAEAKAFDEMAEQGTARIDERKRLAELRDRKKLSDDLETVLARRDDLDHMVKLKACCAAVETGDISRQITVLRRSLVMQDLEKRILSEIEAFDLMHIPFSVNDNSRDGQSFFGVILESAKPVPNNKVLSEGEQRALALACFLGEAGIDSGKHGLIVDDPVSSLDHTRIRRVAIRLVEEANAGRQIIIFTHNILFFNEVVDAAGRATPQVPVLRNFISKTESAGFGIISETDEPWVLLSVTKRIAALQLRLKTFDGVTDFDTDDWRRTAKDFYTDLRETWERLVEEVLLGKVVERFNTDIRTQSLKGVVVEDDDYKTVYWAMKKVSERSGHDMAAGRAIPVPRPIDMKADLDEIDAFRQKANKRRTDTEKKRKALEEPPPASVV